MELIVSLWLSFFFFWIFVLGCAIGSFLNVVIYRLPRGKSIFWPSSRCGACLQPIASSDNIPLWSYLRLRGRCRACGSRFSMRYFWVEFTTGIVFVLLYLVEIGGNLHGIEVWGHGGLWFLTAGMFAPASWEYFAGHALLASLLVAAVACLLDTGRVPTSLAVTGAIAGLAWNLLFPWPRPMSIGHHATVAFVPWPVWEPLPSWLPPGGLLLGALTGLAGALVGPVLLRLVNLALGQQLFDPALLFLAGGFLGWQPVVVAVLFAALCSLLLPRLEGKFPLVLALGLVIAWFGWRWLGPPLRHALFVPLFDLAVLAVIFAVLHFRGGWRGTLPGLTPGRKIDPT